MAHFFGTDGIRGKANVSPLDAETVVKIGKALVLALGIAAPMIVIGRDTRISGQMLEHALCAGIESTGGAPLLAGIIPTPAVSFITKAFAADAGVVVSASHNPFYDNGIKIFSKNGMKISDDMENRIESFLTQPCTTGKQFLPEHVGTPKYIHEEALNQYSKFLKNILPDHFSFAGLKVVIDTANGSTFAIAPALFKEFGAKAEVINNAPDGININAGCGSEHVASLKKKVVDMRADIGLAFDGDGDRLVAVDERGEQLSGDQMMFIFARYLKESNALSGNILVGTIMSNVGLQLACEKNGIFFHKAQVGDKRVMEKLVSLGGNLGGEQSGHMIFSDYHFTGDGLISAFKLLEIMVNKKAKLSDLKKDMHVYPQSLISVEISIKPDVYSVTNVLKEIKDAENILKDKGRVLIRYSGTQPLCRIMVEGPDIYITEKLCLKIAEAVKKELN